jgi:hypothetical protein
VEPAVTNTVSYFKVSAVIIILASPEVIKESFRQEKRIVSKDMESIPRVFIDIKSNVSISLTKNHCTEKKERRRLRKKNAKYYSFSLLCDTIIGTQRKDTPNSAVHF